MRIIIKIGTSTLAHENGRLNIRRVEHLCKVISDLKNSGHERSSGNCNQEVRQTETKAI